MANLMNKKLFDIYRFSYFSKSIASSNQFLKSNVIRRNLYAPSYFMIDKFSEQREKVSSHFGHLKKNFLLRMQECASPDSNRLVFSEDLRNCIYLISNTPEEIELLKSVIKKYNNQNNDLRFGAFTFGPIIMRLMHVFKQPDLAYELISNPEIAGLFDQLKTYLICMDLMFKENRYEEIIKLYDIAMERKFLDNQFNRDIMVLVFGACYKLDSNEKFEYALELLKKGRTENVVFLRKALCFLSALALNRSSTNIALEILSLTNQTNYVTVRNLRLICLTKLMRLDDILFILRTIASRDQPQLFQQPQPMLLSSIVPMIFEAAKKSNDPQLVMDFETVVQSLKEKNAFSEKDLDTLLCETIQVRTERKNLELPRQNIRILNKKRRSF